MQSVLLLSTLYLSLMAPGNNKAQRIYLDRGMQETSKGKAEFYKLPEGQRGDAYIGRIFTMDNVLKAEGEYADAALKVEHGHFKFFHPDGSLESEGDYVMGNKSGVWKRFDKWGQEMAERVYDPDPLNNIVYTMASTMPQYPGGERAMITYLNSKAEPTEGSYASFVVEKDGDLSGIKVIGLDGSKAEEIADALENAPRFEVGEKDGVPVRVQMRVPLK